MLYKYLHNLWLYLLDRCPGVRSWGNTRRSRAQWLYWAKCQNLQTPVELGPVLWGRIRDLAMWTSFLGPTKIHFRFGDSSTGVDKKKKKTLVDRRFWILKPHLKMHEKVCFIFYIKPNGINFEERKHKHTSQGKFVRFSTKMILATVIKWFRKVNFVLN